MCYKFKSLIGFSLAFLFVSTSLPIEAMEEGEQPKSTPKKRILRRGKSITNLLRSHHSKKKPSQEKSTVEDDKDILQLKNDSMEVKTRLKNLQNQKDGLQEKNDSSDEIQLLINPGNHLDKLKKVITKQARKDVIISSQFISKRFIRELFIPWVNRSERDLTIAIYTTPTGEDDFVNATTSNKQRFELNHTITIESLDSCPSNVLIMDQNLFISTSYPWLTFPRSSKGYLLYLAPVIRESQAAPLIKNAREELGKARQKRLENTKDYSLTAAIAVKLTEASEPMESDTSSGRKHDNRGGSIRKLIEARNAEKGDANEEEDINYSGGSAGLSGESDYEEGSIHIQPEFSDSEEEGPPELNEGDDKPRSNDK